MKKKDIERSMWKNHNFDFIDFIEKYKEDLINGNVNNISKKMLISAILLMDDDIETTFSDLVTTAIENIVWIKYIFDDDTYSSYLNSLQIFRRTIESLIKFKEIYPRCFHHYVTQKTCNAGYHHVYFHIGEEYNFPKDPIDEVSVDHITDIKYYINNFIDWHKDDKFILAIKEVFPEYIERI